MKKTWKFTDQEIYALYVGCCLLSTKLNELKGDDAYEYEYEYEDFEDIIGLEEGKIEEFTETLETLLPRLEAAVDLMV
jgi:hypothetical protein